MRIMIALLLAVYCQVAYAGPKTQPSPHRPYPIEEIVSMVNLLTVLSDDEPGAKSLQKSCEVSAKEARSLLLPAHPLWDDAIERRAGELTQKPQKLRTLRSWAQCAKRCACTAYATTLEKMTPPKNPKLKSEYEALLKKTQDLATKQTASELLACASRAKPLCKSRLMAELRAEAPNYAAETPLSK